MDELLQKLLGLLSTLTEEKGVPKDNSLVNDNIVDPDDDKNKKPKEPGALKSFEKRRLTETFNLFNKLFFDYKQKLEGSDPSKPQALITTAAKTVQNNNHKAEEKKGGWGSLLGLLVGGVALVAASIPMLLGGIFDKFGKYSEAIKTIGKLGLWGGLKMLMGTFLKAFAKPILKKLPILGSLLEFWDAYNAFKDNKIAKGVLHIVAGILGFVPGVGPALMMGVDILTAFLDAKGMFDEGGALSNENAWGTIKGWCSDIGNWLWDNALYIPILGSFKRFGMASDAFKSGDYGEGLKQVLWGILSFGGMGGLMTGYEILAGFLSGKLSSEPTQITENSSWSDRMVEWIRGKLEILPWWIKQPLAWFGLIPDSMVGETPKVWQDVTNGAKEGFEKTKNFVGGIWDNLKDPMKDSVDTIKSFAVDSMNKTKEFGQKAWDYVSDEAPKIWNGVKDLSSKAWEANKEAASMIWNNIKDTSAQASDLISKWAPQVIDTMTSITKGSLDALKSLASKIGDWFGSLFSSDDKQKLQEGQASNNQSQLQIAKASDESLSTMIKNSDHQNQWLKLLNDKSYLQIQLLQDMVNIGRESVRELKRIGGAQASGGGSTYIMPSQTSSESSPMMSMGNNRNGYLDSTYAIG